MSEHERTLRDLTAQVERQKKQLEMQAAQLSVQTNSLPKSITDIMSGKTIPSESEQQPYNMMDYLKRTISSKQTPEAIQPPPPPLDSSDGFESDRPKISFALSNRPMSKPVPPAPPATGRTMVSPPVHKLPANMPPAPLDQDGPQFQRGHSDDDHHFHNSRADHNMPSWRGSHTDRLPRDRPPLPPSHRDGGSWREELPRGRPPHDGNWREPDPYESRGFQHRDYDDRGHRGSAYRSQPRGFQRPWRERRY